jgi:polar amino acid transport system substrate-binding protein
MRYFSIFLLLLLFVTGGANAQDSKIVTLVADEWCPYNCKPDSDKPGYMIEIAKAVFEPKGYQVVYRVMPWERAIEDTRRGNYNAIIGAMVDDAPDFVYPSESLGYTSNYFYVKKDSVWKYDGVRTLDGVSLGVIDGYAYEKSLDKYIADNSSNNRKVQVVSGDTGIVQNFKKLDKGRIDAYVEDQNVAQQYIADNNLWGKFKVAGKTTTNAKEHYVYIAFSPVSSDSGDLAKILSDGVKELRANGKMKEILSKYNIEDWRGRQ